MFDEAWRYVDEFRVDQAAALWAGENPAQLGIGYPFEAKHRIIAYKQMLAGAILGGKLKADHSTNVFRTTGNYDASIVQREELIRYAREQDKGRPAFLFDTIAPQRDESKSSGEEAPKNPGGRPRDYDWDMVHAQFVRIALQRGTLPKKQVDLINEILDWFSLGMGGIDRNEYEPAHSSVKSKVSTLYNNIKALEEAERRSKTYSE